MKEKYRFKLRQKWWGKSFYMPAAVYNEHNYNIVMYTEGKKQKTQQQQQNDQNILSIHSNVRKNISTFQFCT